MLDIKNLKKGLFEITSSSISSSTAAITFNFTRVHRSATTYGDLRTDSMSSLRVKVLVALVLLVVSAHASTDKEEDEFAEFSEEFEYDPVTDEKQGTALSSRDQQTCKPYSVLL